jgi:hypothetical protein
MPRSGDPRDARKRLEEEERRRKEQEQAKAGQQPEGGKDPRDPKDRRTGESPEDEAEAGRARDPNVPAWATSLPPEIRDAYSGGNAENIPPQYRDLVRRYVLWLARQRGAGAR